jgi:hypothetical protein
MQMASQEDSNAPEAEANMQVAVVNGGEATVEEIEDGTVA